jgi:hypothetical protein
VKRKHVGRAIRTDRASSAADRRSSANPDGDIDSGRLLTDVAAFESANGVPHDVLAVGVVALGVALVHGVASAVRRVFGAGRPSQDRAVSASRSGRSGQAWAEAPPRRPHVP